MKVGIMSMQRIENYGSYLQALGLKLTIEELGHEVVFVDFKPKHMVGENRLKNALLPRMAKKVLRIIRPNKLTEREKCFREAYPQLGMSAKPKYKAAVDVLVIGSDEVFNFIQTNPNVGYAPMLLGEGSNCKKLISYAASCGNLTLDKVEKYKKKNVATKLLKNFDKISVRDKNTFNFVKELTGKTPESHMDPVLVADFGDMFAKAVGISDYIIIYGYAGRFSVAEGEKIKEFALKRNKKLISFGGRQDFCSERIDCSPYEIPAYFANADCVITDTFHGTIFSILAHKPFLTLVRTDAKVGYGNENKVADLLEKMNLKERILNNPDSLEESMSREIDYSGVERIRKKERERAVNYLKENIRL